MQRPPEGSQTTMRLVLLMCGHYVHMRFLNGSSVPVPVPRMCDRCKGQLSQHRMMYPTPPNSYLTK